MADEDFTIPGEILSSEEFYKQLSPFYKLIYGAGWENAVKNQGKQLNNIIQAFQPKARTILDAACGCGTQSLGLGAFDYDILGTDSSAASMEAAAAEAVKKGLGAKIRFAQADLRSLQSSLPAGASFDVVLACDNAIPHLQTDADILLAFQQLHAATAPGGLCILSVRDYEREAKFSGEVIVKPYGLRSEGDKRYVVLQTWEFEADLQHYDLSFYFIEDCKGVQTTHCMRTKYYAVGTGKLLELLKQAGFQGVQRLDGQFFQPVLVGKKA